MLLPFLLIPLVLGPMTQGNFPHPMEKPNVKIEDLGKARVSAAEKSAIVAIVFAGTSVQECTGDDRTEKDVIDGISIARTSLHPEEHNLLVQANDDCNCGVSGNCSFWILRERPGGFDTLLKTFLVQSFALEPSSSNGYRDVITYAHGSASDGELALYQFDGRRYRKTRCADEKHKLRDDGTFEKKAIITSINCRTKK